MRKFTIPVLAATLILAGCAKEKSTDTSAAAKAYFESWAQVHHPDAQRAGNGIFILEDTPGDGEELDMTDIPYVLVDFTVTDLEGNVVSTTSETLSQQIGSYSPGNTYGPRIWMTGEGFYGIFAGVEDMLTGMKVGGVRKAAIPYWLCTTDRYSTEALYLAKVTSGSNLIYEIALQGIINDIDIYEGDLLDQYSREYLDGADSTHIAGNEDLGKFGFYYKTQPKAGVDLEYTMPDDTTMYLNYTGKFLSGKVFDTTVENVAKRAGIYSASKTYAPVQVTRSATYTGITLGGSSELISGFQAAIFMMHPMEKAVTAFYSPLGYGASGSGMIIPPYTPLVFELELVEKP